MKAKFIIPGILLGVLSSAPLKANPDGLDSATIRDAHELPREFVPEPGILTLLTMGVLTLIAREKLKFDRQRKDKQNARMETYWQDLKKKQPSEQRKFHKTKYRPLEEVPPELLPPDTKQRAPFSGTTVSFQERKQDSDR